MSMLLFEKENQMTAETLQEIMLLLLVQWVL